MRVYEVVTDRIIKELEAGSTPWVRPWKVSGIAPQNLISRKPYRGINHLVTQLSGFGLPYWLTYKQAQELGGHVMTGEHGTPVVFWKMLDVSEDDATEQHHVPMMRYYTIFNVSQCEGIEYPQPVVDPGNVIDPIESAERIFASMPFRPGLEHGGDRAFYRPSTDAITLPGRNMFNSPPEYYSTLFHEMTHSTGHASRLNRKTLTDMCMFGDTNYSKEELVAEMGAAFLCAHAGIENEAALRNSAAYVRGWLKKLRDDRMLLIRACSEAEKACDYILDINAKATQSTPLDSLIVDQE